MEKQQYVITSTQRANLIDAEIGLHVDGAIGAHGERLAQRLLRLLGPDRNDHNLLDGALLLHANLRR